MSHHDRPAVGFVLEQTLGHITHTKNLRTLISDDGAIRAHWRHVGFDVSGPAAKIPGYRSNWTLRSGLRARRAIASMQRRAPLDALFIHTQVPAVLAGGWLRRIPTVVSVDATPLQYDRLGAFYQHERGHPSVERVKWRLNRRCFAQAVHLVSWSQWAKAGLVSGYDVPADKVTVIPPGVDAASWAPPAGDHTDAGPVRILFVGGDFERKGGRTLLEAFARLRRSLPDHDVELHLVTQAKVPATDHVVVHHGMTPNSPDLKALYYRSHVFCLPTRGDCLPMVLSEAGAAHLPLVSTAVGAIPEIVRDGQTGFVIEKDDAVHLARTLETLVCNPELRRRQGANAAALVRERYDAVTNAQQLVDVLVSAARRRRTASRAPGSAARTRSMRGASVPGGRDVLLTVSGTIPPDVEAQVSDGTRPRPDYLVMAEAFGADLLDHARAAEISGSVGRLIRRAAGPHAELAWATFRLRRRYRAVFTDGEQVGLLYALMTRLAGRGGARHAMIAHLMSAPKKAVLFKTCRLGSRIDTTVVYATAQQRYMQECLGVPADKVVLSSFMVDTRFFSPTPPPQGSRPTIAAAGLEYRDYPTMIDAVRGLDVRAVLAAASPWSTRADTTHGRQVPENVEVCRLGFVDLRQLYAESAFVVMPLEDVPFQAGVTTILEAMAMGKAVICSRTAGQTDVILDGETGIYVRPGDPVDLRQAIQRLLADPEEARRMGKAARHRVEEMDVERYARRLRDVILPEELAT